MSAARAGRFDLNRPRHGLGIVGSLVVHAGIAVALLVAPSSSHESLGAVEIDVRRRPPPPPPPAEPEPPPPEPEPEPEPPPRPRATKVAAAPEPPPEAPPPEAPPEPPVFDLSNVATSSEGGWGIATTEGNTLFAPVKSTPAKRGTAPVRVDGAPGGTGTGPATAAPRRVAKRPVVEFEARPDYPEQARRQGIEGVVVLEVQVRPDGRVSGVRVKSDPGYGLGMAARQALLRFRFSPALDDDGRAMPYTIAAYRFRFELPD